MVADYLSSYFLIFLTLAITLIYSLYRYSIRSFNMDQKFGFEGPKPLPLCGNLIDFLKQGFHVCDAINQKRFGHIYPIYMGQIGMMVVSDETILRQILVKDARSFIDRPQFRISSKLMKKNLLQLKGKDWERIRVLVSPTFTSGKLKKMSPLIVASVNDMVQKFTEAVNTDIDVKEIFGSLTMDVIAKTMFGIDINKSSKSNNVFIKHAKKLTNVTVSTVSFMLMATIPFSIKLIEYYFPNGIVSSESVKFFEKSMASTIKCRRNSKEEFHDFLDLVLKSYNELTKEEIDSDIPHETISYKGLTEDEILAQSIVFLLAGYETTSTALTFCSYYLAMNPDAQEEVYQELVENLPAENEITYDMLSNLDLLEQSLNETLRICPPVPRFGRLCTKDAILKSSSGQVIQAKEGMSFVIPVYAIQHDERLWPDPEKYDIHRFDPENKKNRSAFSFIPFGVGPRVCIGQRFALLEAKLALAYLLRNYKILPCEKTPRKLIFGASGLTKVKEPVILRIEPR